MAVIPKVTTALKTFSGKPLSIASKMLGVATCAAVVYDSHINGRERAYTTDDLETGDRFFNQYKQYMTSEKESGTISKMKKFWFGVQQDFPFYHIGSRAKGYIKGFGNTFLKSLPLIALSAVALKFKTAGKFAGVALAAAGVKTFLYDVVGIGSRKSDKRY